MSIEKSCSLISIILLLFCFKNASSQSFTDSNLPIVIINTDEGQAIPDGPKIGAGMKIIFRGEGQRNYITDESNPAYLNYNGRIGIEMRGTTSALAPQKPYGIETRLADSVTHNNVQLLGMPSENDWILLATYIDKSLIRDYFAYYLARQLGDYASRGKYCEVILNGEYQGIYILEEKLKQDKNRVDILEMLPTDETEPNISGGFLLQEDDGGIITLPHKENTGNNAIIIEEPKTYTQAQQNYVQSFLNNLDAVTNQPNSNNLINGYPSLIDSYSFYNYILINELFTNPDGYSRSSYYSKDRNGKLVFGPIWDFNSAGGNNQNGFDFWEIETGFFQGPLLLARIFNEQNFRCHLIKRWQELRQPSMPFSDAKINFTIDSVANSLSEAQERHFQKWPILGDCGTISAHPSCAVTNTHLLEVDYFKQFLLSKANWIDHNIGVGYSNCVYPTIPNLVINEIMYNPSLAAPNLRSSIENDVKNAKKMALYATEGDYEFIEIKNAGTQSIDLTGVYFRGGGIVYQFPANATLSAGALILLGSNAIAFQNRYGFAPFDQFTRDLSNIGEDLILADGMGNTIDRVNYKGQAPWLNAYGKSLELINSTLDNALPENWFQQIANDGSPGLENVYAAPDPCLIGNLPKIIINEINYNSLNNVPPAITNTGDWFEIYNAEIVPVDLSGWNLKDATNTFVIPANTIIGAKDYLVFCQNPASFALVNPSNTKFLNISNGIGLSSSGEIISIYNLNNCKIDEITFGVSGAWPSKPNGKGFTLSLKRPDLDNTIGENWDASTAILGTPGAKNFLCSDTPGPAAQSNSPLCSGSNLNLTSSVGSSYLWTGPNGFSSNIQNPIINNANISISGTYIITVTNENGCTAIASTEVTVNALPIPTAESNSPICGGNTLAFTSLGGVSYTWSGPNNFSSTAQNPSIHNAVTNQSGIYTVTVTNANNCVETSIVEVLINPSPPSLTAQADTSIILGESISLMASGCTGGIGNFELKWYKASDNSPISMPISPTVTGGYFAKCEQTVNGILCESAKSDEVILSIGDIIISVQTGNWEDISTWNSNRIPTSIDKVIVDSNHTVTIDGAAAVKFLELRTNANLNFTNPAANLKLGF